MSPNLNGKVCLVTGASQGIGKGIALQLGEAGAIVYITGRNKANLEKAAKEIKERGAQKSIPLQGTLSNIISENRLHYIEISVINNDGIIAILFPF